MSQWLCYGRHFKGWEEKHKNVWSRCNKSSRGFTVYQKCDLEDILLLKDNSDEYYTANNFPPLIVKTETLEQLVNFKWDQVSSQLQSIILGWEYQVVDLDQIFWSARNPIEYLSKNPSWYIAEPFGSSSVENTSLLHIPVKWLISTDYYQKITLLTWRSCQMNVTAKVYYSSFYLSRRNGWSLFKPLLLLWCYMILSIIFLNRWVFPFITNDSTYIFCPRFSTSTGMFPIWWPTTATDIWKLRRKWSKLHVIYFSIIISSWISMM